MSTRLKKDGTPWKTATRIKLSGAVKVAMQIKKLLAELPTDEDRSKALEYVSSL